MNAIRSLTGIAVVSVILNLVLVGFVVGQRLPGFAGDDPARERMMPPPGERGPRARMPMGPGDLNFLGAARALDGERRREVVAAFRGEEPELRARVDAMAEKRAALLDLLASEPADMERLAQALAELRAAGAAAQEYSHRLFLDIAGRLPPDQRAAFLKAAAQRGPRPPAP